VNRRDFLRTSGLALLDAAAQTPAPATDLIIDIHQHLGYSGRPDDVLLAHQRTMGITRTILLPAGRPVKTPSTHDGASNGLDAKARGNEACYRFARSHRRQYAFGANEVPDLDGATREIARYLKRGAVIIAEQKFGVACDSPAMERIYQLAQDHGVPVLMHWQFERYNLGFERFHRILEKYPRVSFLGHAQTWWGNIDRNHADQTVLYPKGPVTPGGLTDRYLADYPNMYADLSAGSGLNALTRDEDFTRDFITRQQDKLVFGSDCSDHEGSGPKCQGSQTIATIKRLSPNRDVERKLLYGNAKKLFRLLAIAAALVWIPGLASAQTPDPGRAAYEARCVGCHASDGTGGGHGPAIVELRQPKASTRAAIRDLIRNGVPNAGMPAFPIPDAELEAIVGYVEALKTPAADHPTAGDPAAGERFFTGKGNCSTCHIVRGRGGILGPDLSNLARERKALQIERALLEPGARVTTARGAEPPPSYKALTVRLSNGTRLRGVARYEGPFDIGLQSIDGKFHSIERADVAELVVEPSVMPKLQASPEEMRDLLAYLTRLTADRSPESTLPGTPAPGGGEAFGAIVKPAPGEWPTYHGHLSGNRHSPLDQINTTNVARLAPAWTFPVPGGQGALQVTPVVIEGLMYVTAANAVWALDARTGRQVWHYSRPRTKGLVGDPASGINRGVAILGDRLFLQTDHAHLIALHRIGGQLLWDVEIADYRQHYGSTSAPLVVNDLVIAGVSGGDEGNRGFLDAYKASTGERVWRFWTVPARGEPGSETWIGKALEHGCAATWLTGTYDPDARLLYWPTGNPCPDYNGDERKGDNLYSNSVLALNPDTGKLVWHFQFTPHDLHDWDATETPMLVDLTFRGRPRKLLLHADRNGFFYALDRISGELLLAEPFVKNLTWASGIGKDGRPIRLPNQEPTPQGTRVCPSVTGATNWPSMAFSPATGLFYLMAEESCGIFTKNSQWWEQGKSFYGGGTRRSPGDVSAKYLRALDVQTGRIAWEIPGLGGGVLASGVMTTAGGLLFYGDAPGGAFVAADAKTGKLLWHFNTGHGWKAGPMTYAIEGTQYVGVAAGSTIVAFRLQQ
jgi:PQQ-dependent dehydrogenase (methanol/ethanol family)